MTIDPDKLLRRHFEPVEQAYTSKDSILYALGLGFGRDPLDTRELPFVYEERQLAVPTQAAVLGYPGFWMKEPDTGIDWRKVLHASQSVQLHRPLTPAGTVIGRTRVKNILDKGPDVGALFFVERTLETLDGSLLATVEQAVMARGNGGFGGASGPSPAAIKMPEGTPDHVCDLPTLPSQALLYRLSGDLNPLHADPEVARSGGFDRPILHGLCSYGIACHALLRMLCDYDPARLKRIDVRFSAPVYPGETIRVESWGTHGEIRFRATALERQTVVLTNGLAVVDDAKGASA
ncbi:MaoC family dehydratase [Achromobacter denitrificans]|uniref:MaoC family dehydratase n=1 Tax=Achromobacter denitrificans TaxID=32002 RepID=UPI000F66F994|nr:MaoC family dehydratase [Achromobacter denitrificans]RSE83988.1 MaoC family dehydratase [Achromobacter denitrificans]